MHAQGELPRPYYWTNRHQAFDRAHKKTRQARLLSILTQEQWQGTIAFFNGLCAYCTIGDWLFIEHVTPISRGGGTTIDNCLPACKSCNSAKKERSIEECLAIDLWPHRTARLERALGWLQQNGRAAINPDLAEATYLQ